MTSFYFWELPEKSKLPNQSCRRSSWDFITSIACLHEYLSFLTDPICHNGFLSGEKWKRRNGARDDEKKKKRESTLLNWCTAHVSASWLGREIRGKCRKTCFLQQCSRFPFWFRMKWIWPVENSRYYISKAISTISNPVNNKWLFILYSKPPFHLVLCWALAYLCCCKANDVWNCWLVMKQLWMHHLVNAVRQPGLRSPKYWF